jgi:hypothetical protein
MKRLLLANLLTVLIVPAGLATTTYINNGTVSIISPPQIIPSIDASNFVNNGTFNIVNNNSVNQFQPPLPYETWNTRNWTNSNRMTGDPGFKFDYFDSVSGTNAWSSIFQNSGNVNETNSLIYGESYLLVAATNVYEKGTLAVGPAGLLAINGKALDLTRGTVAVLGNSSNTLAGVQDSYWGVGNDIFYAPTYGASNVFSPDVLVTSVNSSGGGIYQYLTSFQRLFFTDFFTAHIRTNSPNPSVVYIDALFLRQTNPAIATEVRFSPGLGGASKIVQWMALQTNRVNGAIITNSLYLTDNFASWGLSPALVQTAQPVPIYQFLAAATFHPYNFSFTRSTPFGYPGYDVIAPGPIDPAMFQGTNFLVESTNSAYAATITAAPFPPNPTIQGATWSNTPGRIEIIASGPGSSLNLSRARIDGEGYLLLQATNHFIGTSNAVIVAPIADIYLGSTNGMMSISNLTTPFVGRVQGLVQAWSGRWTNAAADGTRLIFNVTMVDSQLIEKTPSQIQNLSLRSTNLLIGDALNVFNYLLLDTTRLTISTNAANAPTPYGELNLSSGDLLWSASLPTLQYLTNFGRISSSNSIFFGGSRNPPYFTGTYTEPYQAFVSHGIVDSQGNSTWAKYYEFSDTNTAGIGPISVQATTAILTNGAFIAPDAEISITAGSLLISNQYMLAGRSISLTVTNYLDDGSLTNNVASITNQNTWITGGGISLLRLPTNSSLLATTVTNNAFDNAEVDNYWAGRDYGPWPSGFVNNGALGRLILNGASDGSLFAFFRTGATNALYVDLLELSGATTNADALGDFVGIYLQTNFTLYYGDAIVDGHSIAEKLNAKHGLNGTNGGRFLWVSNYNTGFFSSTNVTYTDGSVHQLNRAVVYSCNINSNGEPYPPTGGNNATCDGSVLKPDAVPVLTPSTLILTAKYTNSTPRKVTLTWNTIPYSSNYLFAASSPLATGTNWQLLTNFLSPNLVSGQVSFTEIIKTNTPRYYRVRAESP